MSGFVDIHSHVLPGIDDGPADLAGSLAMGAAAVESGTAVLAATPHLRSDFPAVEVAQIATGCARLQSELDARGVGLRVVAGAETSLVWALDASEEDLRLATYGQRGTDLLIETPAEVSMLEQLLYQVRLRGPRVILAHPERSPTFKREPDRLARLAAQGILLQVNADILTAPRGSTTRRLAERICQDGLAHVIASDGHRATDWRPVGALAAGVAPLAALVGPARARWMSVDVPAAIIAGTALPPDPGVEAPRRGLFRRRGRPQ